MSLFQFLVNGEWIEFDDFEEDWSLSHCLRSRLCLTGTKIGCGSGSCGSCTVILSKYNVATDSVEHIAVNSCTTPIYSVYGCHVLTIEGVTGENGKSLDPIQDSLARGSGTQCGFCSCGIVMSVVGMIYGHEKKDADELTNIKSALHGNLCRCTGYRPILESLVGCTKDCGNCTEPCSTNNADIEDTVEANNVCKTLQLESKREVKSIKSKFSEIEKLLREIYESYCSKSRLRFSGRNASWYIPLSLASLKKTLFNHPNAVIVGGGVSNYIQSARQSLQHYVLVDVTRIPEFHEITLHDTYVKVGGSCTITETEIGLNQLLESIPNEKGKLIRTFIKLISLYGSQQIRNIATIGGNLGSIVDHSDFQTLCTAFSVKINYHKLTDIDDDDSLNQLIISDIEIPLSTQEDIAWFEKISRRKHCDTAILNAGFIHNSASDGIVNVTFGGMTINRFSIAVHITDREKVLFDETKLIETMADNYVKSQFTLDYVTTLSKNLIIKFWTTAVTKSEISDHIEFGEKYFKASQLFPNYEDSLPTSTDLVYKPVPHASSLKHVTGEAKFCDDIPKFQNEMELAFVLSTKANAKILNVDFSQALELDENIGIVTNKDLKTPENNKFGIFDKDEEIFASDKVTAKGQIIAGIVANDRVVAQRAADLVQVTYEDLEPLILTNEDAINHDSYYPEHNISLKVGEIKDICGVSPYIISGEVKVGSQEHFYMEPQSCIAIPKGENSEMEIIASTQNPSGIQNQVANALNVPANRIVVKVKRVGGGFGGKELRCFMIALPTAVAANKFARPVRCILDRKTDMMITGKRHFILARQKIAFDEKGKLQGLRMSVFANAGNTLDASMAATERLALNIDNAYKIPILDFEAKLTKTNIPSNTVMRGTGGPQAAFLMENIMDTIAATVNKDPVEIKQQHLYKEGDQTHYGQILNNCNVRRCWEQCLLNSDYKERKLQIEEFNQNSVYLKRGISINPCHYGIGYTVVHLNQGAALVQIYTDGSVLLSHGGVEIGQGVHSKMIQIVTRELGICASKVQVTETSTDKVPNSTPSSASVTSDLQGMAVQDACRQLAERLQPYWTKNPDITWEELVNQAYLDRTHLSAVGFYKVPDISWDGKKGSPWNYYSAGAACTEVELDCLTGKYQILRTDIVMDVGKSLNPAIDIGQIEGAFMQGVGLFMMENVIYDDQGELLTNNPETYKIPTCNEVPLEFNVSLLENSDNTRAIYSSKTVGEPPLLLSTSVFFAVKDAIRAYRKSTGKSIVFDMDSPATIDQILKACSNN